LFRAKKKNFRKKRNFIIAGEKSETTVFYHDYSPDFQIPLLGKDTTIGQITIASPIKSGFLNIDFDSDNISDIEIFAKNNSASSFFASTPKKVCCIIKKQLSIQYIETPFHINDTINKTGEWKETGQQEPPFGNLGKLSLLQDSSRFEPEIKINNWTGTNKYLAIRMITKNDTIYGWIGIQIEDYCTVTIRDYAIVKCNLSIN